MRLHTEAAGFHLLELTMVLLTVTALAGLGVWSASALQAVRLRGEANALAARIQESMLRALQQEQDFVLELTREGYAFSPRSTDATPLFTHSLPRGMRVAGLEAGAKRVVRIYSSGTVTPETLTIETERMQCTIVLSLRGRVRLKCQEPAPPA